MKEAVSVLSAGIVVVDHVAAAIPAVPRAGELTLTEDCQLHIGGCASNVAINLTRLGVATRVAGCVGTDVFGEFAKSALETEGVDAADLMILPDVPTSQTLVLNVLGEDRRFIHLIGANGHFGASMLPIETVERVRALYVGGYFLMDRLDARELARVFRSAQSAGVSTVLDVVTPGPRDYLTSLSELLPFTDYFLPNSDEGSLMTGLSDPMEQARRFRQLGAKRVIVTRGQMGCVFSSEEEEFCAAAFDVSFVDGTGGGDAFTAGFLAGCLQGLSAAECVRWGSALGASCVQASGATKGVFGSTALEQFLAAHPLRVERVSAV